MTFVDVSWWDRLILPLVDRINTRLQKINWDWWLVSLHCTDQTKSWFVYGGWLCLDPVLIQPGWSSQFDPVKVVEDFLGPEASKGVSRTGPKRRGPGGWNWPMQLISDLISDLLLHLIWASWSQEAHKVHCYLWVEKVERPAEALWCSSLNGSASQK